MIRRNKIRDSKKQYALNWVITCIFILYCITVLYPFVWNFLVGFMERREYAEKFTSLVVFPNSFNLDNYIAVLTYKVSTGGTVEWSFLEMTLNTVWMGLSVCVLSMVLPVCCSYCCARYNFLGGKFFFYYGVVFCAIPLFGGTSTYYRIVYALNIYDTYFLRFFNCLTGAYGPFLFLYAFFRGLSGSLAESGFIDGASDFQVFWYIMLPQVVPILITFTIGNFIAQWNDWSTSYLFTPSIPTVAFGIQMIVKRAGFGDAKLTVPMSYAGLFLMIIVPMTLFLIFSKRILNTVYTGGLKG